MIDCLPSNESGKSKPNYVKNKQNMALMQISLYCTATKDCFVGMKKRISYKTRYQVTDCIKKWKLVSLALIITLELFSFQIRCFLNNDQSFGSYLNIQESFKINCASDIFNCIYVNRNIKGPFPLLHCR